MVHLRGRYAVIDTWAVRLNGQVRIVFLTDWPIWARLFWTPWKPTDAPGYIQFRGADMQEHGRFYLPQPGSINQEEPGFTYYHTFTLDWPPGSTYWYYIDGISADSLSIPRNTAWFSNKGVLPNALALPNAGWENPTAAPWTLTPGSAGGVAEISDVAPRTGAQCLLLTTAPSGGSSRAYLDVSDYNDIASLVGRPIAFSTYAMSVGFPDARFQLQVLLQGQPGGNDIAQMTWFESQGVYTPLTVISRVIAPTCTLIRIFCVSTTFGPGSWRSDDMYLQRA